ncbi:FecR family protein [Acetobacter persici]|uniref:FecR N-terminal domain-containing protein n=1 Tax=Acetobacter persici TaxID=1076596 RepID=A0A1U9LDL4_9PROT|nr:DUF4880 domain-containing protein [Acetobacter persici]AQT04536.1 hypothetical protein A0U91_05675 [Acetobacter persici]
MTNIYNKTTTIPPSAAERYREEAIFWVTHLHAAPLTPEKESAFQEWLQTSEAHQTAFEQVTNIWDTVGSLSHSSPETRQHYARKLSQRRRFLQMGMAAVLAAGVSSPLASAQTIATNVGERRRVTLDHNAELLLDCLSALVKTHEQGKTRSVFSSGQGFLTCPSGTDLQCLPSDYQVGRMQGQINLKRTETQVSIFVAQGIFSFTSYKNNQIYTLTAGDRVVLQKDSGIKRDRPHPHSVTAWLRNRIVFNDDHLDDVVRQMNQYDGRQIVLRDKRLSSLQISGEYTLGNNMAFCHSLALLLPVKIETGPILNISFS